MPFKNPRRRRGLPVGKADQMLGGLAGAGFCGQIIRRLPLEVVSLLKRCRVEDMLDDRQPLARAPGERAEVKCPGHGGHPPEDRGARISKRSCCGAP